ncbi:SUF system NifU family Fe-S cluster assembly protein [Vallitaleaceae bacterium 9-2]
MSLDMIYNDLIIEHSRNTSNRGPLPKKTHLEHGHNPNCGDDIELELNIDNGIIKEAAFVGSGCAISMASTSMMIDLIKGNTIEEAKKKVDAFLELIKNEKTQEEVEQLLEDATLLSNIQHMPARVKCAVLAWHTLKNVIDTLD